MCILKFLWKNVKGSSRHKWKNNTTVSEGVRRIQVVQDISPTADSCRDSNEH